MKEKKDKALALEYLTVGYNIVEACASIIAGAIAGSVALIGFGLDSIVESLSGGIIIWRLKGHKKLSVQEEKEKEEKAVRFVGITFFILGIYILIESARKIYNADPAASSIPGIVIAAISLIVMPLLAYKKYTLGKELNMKSLIADSKETLVCSFLSFALLIGLLLNYLLGLWIADPIVGIIVSIFLFKEGKELLFEDDEDD